MHGGMPWSTQAFNRTVREIEHHEVVNSGMLAPAFEDKSTRSWTRSALMELELAAESYMNLVGLYTAVLNSFVADYMYVFNVAATMCKHAGRVQLEQSDLRLTMNIMDKSVNGLSSANVDETLDIIRKPRAELREEKRRGVEFKGHKNVKSVMKVHPAMNKRNELEGCLTCQNNVPHNPATRWKRGIHKKPRRTGQKHPPQRARLEQEGEGP
jgi:hypothetical protein